MLLIILVVVLIFGLPSGWYAHSRTDGNYVYSGGVGIGTVALILLLLFLFGGGLGGFPYHRW